MRRFCRILPFALLLTILLLAGCAAPAAEPAAEPAAPTPAPVSEDEVRVAVLAIRSATSASSEYGPIVDYLGETLGRPFVFVPVEQDTQFDVVANNEVDFTINNPLAAVELRRMYDTRFLATLSRIDTGPEFSSVIIARKESGITKPEDVRGKHVTCVNFKTAAAGCVFQIYHLLQAGVTVDEFASFVETPSQDNIVLGVLNGTYDVGFIRTGQLEAMLAEGTITTLDDIQIVDQAQDDFFYPHTTRLYPEWPFAALKDTDPALADAVAAALLAIPADHPALKKAKADGFVPPLDYTPLDDLIVALELPGFDAK